MGKERRWNGADRGNRYWEREMWVRSDGGMLLTGETGTGRGKCGVQSDGGMLLIGETSNGRESCPSVILSSTNVMWTDLGSKPA